MKHQGKWTSSLIFFYYVVGALYYVYQWIFILAGAGLLAGVLLYFADSTIVAPLVLTGSFCLGVMACSFMRRRIRSQIMSNNPSLKIKELKAHGKLQPDGSCSYKRLVECKAIHPVGHYKAKFCYSGNGQVKGAVVGGAKRIHIADEDSSNYTTCQIEFERPLNRGEELTFGYTLEFFDETKPMRPFFGHAPDMPIPKLHLEVDLSCNPSIHRYKRQLFLSNTHEMPLFEENVELSASDRIAKWDVTQAKDAYYYRITW